MALTFDPFSSRNAKSHAIWVDEMSFDRKTAEQILGRISDQFAGLMPGSPQEGHAIGSEPGLVSARMWARICDDFVGLVPLPKPAVQERAVPAFPFAAYKVMLDG